MKPMITGFFNQDGKTSLNESIKKAQKHEIEYLALRSFDGVPLIELSEGELKKILLDSKSERIKFSILDSNITPYNLYDEHKHHEALDEFKYMLKVAERLKINHIFLKLPIINHIIEEFETIEKRLGDFIDAASRASKKIVLQIDKGYKVNTYVYIFNKMKSKYLTIAFDPVTIMANGESLTTTYRLLKSYISVLFAHDANHQGEPELMGYGKTDILKILKKLERDRFNGFIVVDHQFSSEIFNIDSKKKGFFNRLFSQDKKKEKRKNELSRRIFPDEETKNVTEDDILDNQIKLLKTIFK